MDERYSGTLQNMLIKNTGRKKNEWDIFLDACVFVHNTLVHESTRFSPFELMFGQKPVLPVDINMGSCDLTALDEYREFSPSTFKRVMEYKSTILEEAKVNSLAAQKTTKRLTTESIDKKV